MTSQQPAARFPTGSHDSLANWLALLALGIVWPFADAATLPAGHGGSLLVKAR